MWHPVRLTSDMAASRRKRSRITVRRYFQSMPSTVLDHFSSRGNSHPFPKGTCRLHTIQVQPALVETVCPEAQPITTEVDLPMTQAARPRTGRTIKPAQLVQFILSVASGVS